MSSPSICIPRIIFNVDHNHIKLTFESIFGIGTIDRIDIVPTRNTDYPFTRAFIHFTYWPDDHDSIYIRNRLINGNSIKIVHDYPRFWKCYASRFT